MTENFNITLAAQNALVQIEHFVQVLNQETSLVRNQQHAAVQNLQPTKIQAAQTYQQAVLLLQDHAAMLAQLPDMLRDALKTAYNYASVAMADNIAALKAGAAVAERMVKVIIQAAKQTVMDGPNYNAHAYTGPSARTPVHFQLNEVL
jgi:hypothetical protein